jgi:hypothetical protein
LFYCFLYRYSLFITRTYVTWLFFIRPPTQLVNNYEDKIEDEISGIKC